MRLLRFAILFAFFAISMARALCDDFEIFANQTSLGCDIAVNAVITYGEPLILSIAPETGDIRWKAGDAVIGTAFAYPAILPENTTKTIIYAVERNGVEKTISVNLQERQSFTVFFDLDGGSATPAINPQNILKDSLAKEPSGTLTKASHIFDGWDFNFNTPITKDTIIKAKWEFSKTTPTKEMLDFKLSTELVYTSLPIDPIPVTQNSSAYEQMGAITVLYNGSAALPTNAGTYAISASILENEHYNAAIILLGEITIDKKTIALSVSSGVAQNREYNGTTAASITSLVIDDTGLLANDQGKINSSYYSIANANFASPNAGIDIEVSGTLNWLPNNSLSGNYNLLPVTFNNLKANITQAKGILQISALQNYELSNPVKPSVINKSSFVKEEDIIWEYKREGESAYSQKLPDRVGNWIAKAYFDQTLNYTGAVDSTVFSVIRGNAAAIIQSIEFADPGFDLDTALSSKLRHYYVASASLCQIKSSEMQITVKEADIILRIGNTPQKGIPDENGFARYDIPFELGKPGLNMLIYELLSRDGVYSEFDTVLVETPIPFDAIVLQKWNNVLFVNNNPQTNGGYKFTDFKWFENNEEVSSAQFYSAGPSSQDTLNPSDVYKVVMQTESGIRLSTCQGSAKIKEPEPSPKLMPTKQVLGINDKSIKSGAKIYNLNGKLTKETPAGVYIVK